MKILHINKKYASDGGADIYLLDIMRELGARGHENIVVYESASGSRSEADLAFHMPELVRPSIRRHDGDMLRLTELIERENPDLIHIHDIGNAFTVARCAALRPTVRTMHDHAAFCPGTIKYYRNSGRRCQRPFGLYCLYSAYANWCNSRSPDIVANSYLNSRREFQQRDSYARVLVASQFMKDQLLLNGYDETKIDVIPYFTYPPDEPAGEPEDLGEEDSILFLGRVAEVKGLDKLIQALRLIDARCNLLVAGDGYSLEQCRKLAKKLGVQSRVEFLGWVDREEKQRLLARCALLVVPSLWPEPFGIVGIEAMAFARPVMGFDVGGISEWLKDGEVGYLVPPNDTRMMAEKISYLLEHPDAAKQMGMAGRTVVKERFSPESHVNQLLRTYKAAMGGT